MPGIYTASGGLNVTSVSNLGLYAPTGQINTNTQAVLNIATNATLNGVAAATGTATATSKIFSSSSIKFVAADVGKLISIVGAGVTGAVLNTTIASVNSNGTANLTTAASTTVNTTAVFTYGNDDTAAWNAAVVALAALPNGGVIQMPVGTSLVSSITWASNVSLVGQGAGKSILKHVMVTDAVDAMIYVAAGGSYNYNNQFHGFEMDMSAATDATLGYSVLASCIRIPITVGAVVRDCYIHDSPATGLAFDYGINCRVTGNIIYNCGRLASGQIGGAGLGCAISTVTPTSQAYNQQSWICTDNFFVANGNYGAFWEAEVASTQYPVATICNNNIFILVGGVSAIGDCGSTQFECVGNHIYSTSGNSGPAIVVKTGTTGYSPGVQGIIEDNVLFAVGGDGIRIDYTATVGSTTISAYKISGNKISSASLNGIKIGANATDPLLTVLVDNNIIQLSQDTAIALVGAGGIKDAIIRDNVCFNNGISGSGATTAAIDLGTTITRCSIMGNVCFDNLSGTQKYGLAINGTVTGAYVVDNNFSNNGTSGIGAISGSIAGVLINNLGYNPVGASAAGVSGSPWTFTAPTSPGTLYISSSATITAVTQNGTSIFTQSLTTQDFIIPFNANDTIIVTYTGTLTGIKMVN